MNEAQIRNLLGKGLPKVAASALNAVYPARFRVVDEPSNQVALQGAECLSLKFLALDLSILLIVSVQQV